MAPPVIEDHVVSSVVDDTSLVMTTPIGAAQGDLLLCAISFDGAPTNIAISGWSPAITEEHGSLTTAYMYLHLASTPSASYTVTWTGTESARGSLIAISGHDSGDPIDVDGGSNVSGSIAFTPTNVTTTAADCLVLAIVGCDRRNTMAHTASTETTLYLSQSSGIADIGNGVSYQTQATPGATTQDEWTLAPNVDDWAAIVVAIQPPSGPPATQIDPDSITHGHTIGSPSITQAHNIAPASITHPSNLDSPDITQDGDLAPAALGHGHTLDSPTITQVHLIAPADLTHGHTLDSPTIDVEGGIAPNPIGHPHTLGSPTITQVHLIAPLSLTHGHTLGSPDISGPVVTAASVEEMVLYLLNDLPTISTTTSDLMRSKARNNLETAGYRAYISNRPQCTGDIAFTIELTGGEPTESVNQAKACRQSLVDVTAWANNRTNRNNTAEAIRVGELIRVYLIGLHGDVAGGQLVDLGLDGEPFAADFDSRDASDDWIVAKIWPYRVVWRGLKADRGRALIA